MSRVVIETEQLVCRFGRQLAVDRIDLSVPAASVYGFLGPNGAGKTTTIRALLGLLRPQSGSVRLFGCPLDRRDPRLLARVGALVETPSLYPHLTGRENLEVTRRLLAAPRAGIERALSIVKLAGDADRRVREYSLGMRQRLGLALALMHQPEAIILDEPTNGLDPAGIHEIRALLRALPRDHGITVFLSSHLLSEVEQIADQIGIIDRGRLLFQGPLDQLKTRHEHLVELRVDRPDDAQRELVAAGWNVAGQSDQLLIVRVDDINDAARLNHRLVMSGFAVSHLRIVESTLESIFLALTEPGAEAKA